MRVIFIERTIGAARWLVVSIIVLCVRAYQVAISPHLGRCCRFEPSCSEYCIAALRTHGFFKGSWLTVRRIMRCRPFGPAGYDPVPSRKEKRKAER